MNHLFFANDSMLTVKTNVVGAMEINDMLNKYLRQASADKCYVSYSKGCLAERRHLIKVTLNVPNEALNEKCL
jgi:hypothetical protein